MTAPAFDVVAFGNPLVDVLSHEDDDFPDRVGIARGTMGLVDAARADEIYAAMGPGTEISGGSAANTAVGLASFGGRAAFVGRVRDDEMGEVFRHDLRATGVDFETPAATEGPPTGRCLVVVTPDAQRSMSTYLGCAGELAPGDVDADLVRAGAILFLEGYLWEQPPAKAAIRDACRVARDAGRRVALTLSDPFVVDNHREELLTLLDEHVDVLFANQIEVEALYEVDDFDDALAAVRGVCDIAALTRSEQGSVVVAGDDVHVVPAHHIDGVVDTTGAGDLYAAGFLYGLTHGRTPEVCAQLGSLAAGEVISHLGARPLVSLAELAAPLLG